MTIRSIRLTALPVLIAAMLFSSGTSALAASKDDREVIKVVSVSLNFANPEPGDPVDKDMEGSVSADDGTYEITEAEYTTKKEEWEYNDKPILKIKVKIPKDDQDSYKFRSKAKLSLDKGDVKIDKSDISNSSTSATVTVYLRPVTGKTDTTSDFRWDGNYTANWERVDTAQSYTVRLYRNSSQVADVTTTATHVNLASYMTTPGKYSFRIRSNAGNAKDNSRFSERSDYVVITQDNLPTAEDILQGDITKPVWAKDGDYWYIDQGGQKLHNTWFQDTDGNWYYLGADTYMKTGLFKDSDGNQYYLNTKDQPDASIPLGAMRTGWLTYHDRTYYLNPNEGGPKGSMLVNTTVTIDGKECTFNEDGALQQ
ncbi:MAG: hypothetical protein PUB12_05925 [[Clostridium] aminophilum]|uniref:N-acetylmuramoyl-L-alanine amidase family protein n=1 Tax=[Clostridium] aminophilum TaxID=1526 RepID=UPI0026EFC542|nr:hypothetical protein [[Clostridium] aminophilum]MDD6196409.1 hypothetical protein [[Clostridium] aminophilum]